MRGYWGRPEDTARALAGGWLRTGDVGFLDAEGALHVLDRRDDLIVTGGENVYPAEVETALLAHPRVRDAGVAAVADAEFGHRPAAWVVTDGEVPAADLERFCRERLASYKVPVHFRRVAALPRNASGKLLRRRLADGVA